MKIETYKEPKWVALRNKILRRDQYLDQYEKRYGRFKNADIVHHIFPVDEFPEYQFCEWNLISVSRATHNSFHDRLTDELTDKGRELLRYTARRNKIEVPSWYAKDKTKGNKFQSKRFYHD